MFIYSIKGAVRAGAIVVLSLALRFGFPTRGACQSQTKLVPEAPTEQMIHELKGGYFGPTTDQEIQDASTGQLILVLKEKFERDHDFEIKDKIASALVRLGDQDNLYWNYLVERVEQALSFDAPSSACIDPADCPSKQYIAWAKAHHVDDASTEASELRDAFQRIELLAYTRDPRAIPILRRALQSQDWQVQSSAAEGLAELRDKGSISLIVNACKQAPAPEARAIAGALELFDDPAASQAEIGRAHV